MASGSRDRLDTAGENGNWNGDVADGNENSDGSGSELQQGRVDGMAETERLKHAPEAVIEVITKHDHGDDVEERHRPELKAVNNVVVNVVRIEGAAGMDGAKSEMKKMEDKESEDDGAAPHHGARSVGRSDVGLFHVGDRTRFPLEEPELEGRPDVQEYGEEKREASTPERAGVSLQEFRIVIDFFGRLIDLEIAD